MRSLVFAACWLFSIGPAAAQPSKHPDCWHWPTTMAFVQLKNAGVLDNRTDPDRAQHVRIASQRIGADLYRQVYDVHFARPDGSNIEVITVSDASKEECSMGDVRVLRVTPVAP